MELHGRLVSLRPIEPADAPVLAAILAEPAVARWWGTFDLERVRRDLTAGDPDEEGFAIEHEGAVVGYIQAVEEREPDFRHAGIDLFLRTSAQGRGLGPDAIRTLAAHLIDDRGHHRMTIDPAAANEHAIRPTRVSASGRSASCGSTSGSPMARWVDALLMDLLAHELVR